MKHFAVLLLLPLTLAISIGGAFAAGHSSSHSGSSQHSSNSSQSTHHAKSSTTSHASRSALGVTRDSHGKIARSRSARSSFEHSHPCPSTGKTSGACPGYVVDHVTPLKRAGADKPDNMQLQTVETAKAKDKTK